MSTPLVRRRGRPKVTTDDAQRQAIVLQAHDLFLEKGYGGTTTGEVAARCRISKQTLYRLFPGKLALFTAVIDAHRQDMLDFTGATDDLPLEEALARIFKTDIDVEANRTRVAFTRLIIVESGQFPEIRNVFKQHGGDRSRVDLAGWLTRQHRLGRIDIGDAVDDASMLTDMIFGGIIQKELDGFQWPGGERRPAYIRRCIDIFLNGVRCR